MSRKTLFVFIAFSIALTACAPEVQAQLPAATQSPTSTPLPVTTAAIEAGQPTPARTPNPTPSPELQEPGRFETSVLVAGWNSSERKRGIYLLDPDSGQALPEYTTISLGESYYHAFSPGRRTLAIATYGSLLLVDLATWKERDFDLQLHGYVSGLVFDSEGRRLAIVYGDPVSEVTLFDLDKEAVTAQGSLDLVASRLKFTADGRGLMIYGTVMKNRFTANEMTAGPPSVVLLDASDLSTRWSAELEGVRDGIYPKDEAAGEKVDLFQPGAAFYVYPGLAFAPDRDALYVIHPDQDKLTTVDFTAQKVETVEIHTPLTWLERLLSMTAGVAHAKVAEGTSKRAVVSPDGQLLYVVGLENTLIQDKNDEWQIASKPLGLQVVRTADGTRLDSFDTQADDLSIAPDGRFLYLNSWGNDKLWTEVYDTSDGNVVGRLEGILRPASRMNGELLLTASDWIDDASYRMAVVDPRSLTVLADWTEPQYTAWLGTP